MLGLMPSIPRSSNADDQNFEQTWAQYAEEIEGLEPAESALAPAESAPLAGPRDWTPADESDLDDDPDSKFYADLTQPVGTSHDGVVFLWAGSIVALVLAILMAFSVIPGGGIGAGIAGSLTFVFAAIAAFLSSPHSDSVDPFDDGARV